MWQLLQLNRRLALIITSIPFLKAIDIEHIVSLCVSMRYLFVTGYLFICSKVERNKSGFFFFSAIRLKFSTHFCIRNTWSRNKGMNIASEIILNFGAHGIFMPDRFSLESLQRKEIYSGLFDWNRILLTIVIWWNVITMNFEARPQTGFFSR